MSFRLWHYLGRVLVPVLFLAAILAIVVDGNPILRGIGVAAALLLLVLGLVGGVMGLFLSCGRLRMRCPWCGQRGTVGVVSRSMALECPTCGLVYETGLLKLRLAREVREERAPTVEDTPVELRGEWAVFPRGWTFFQRWRTLRWFLLMLLGPATGLAAACWRGYVVAGCMAFVLSVVCGAIAFVFMCSGVSSSNWGTYTRAREPIRFWADVALLVVLYLAISLGGWIIR